MSSVDPSAPPAYDTVKSYPPGAPLSSDAAGQQVQMQPLLGPQTAYPVQAGMQYPPQYPVSYGQPPRQPVMLGQPGMQQQNPGWYPATGPVYIQQQPQQQIIIGCPPASYIPHIVLSCFVTWCCCFCFGLIAFVLAIFAHNNARSPLQQTSARSYARASIGFSIAGILTIVIIVVVLVVLNMNTTSDDNKCSVYTVLGKCYNFRLSSSIRNCGATYYDGYCYF